MKPIRLNNPASDHLRCLNLQNLPEWKYTTSILNLTHSKPGLNTGWFHEDLAQCIQT